uniref:immunoglobulin iota chain-like n=1 Tax=Odobenus rosmarus divergens TaxID=9708 RepID=UPI00063CEBD9|nr:PREDICTED: immunoglobulin iota chain-like [Odobenus rosmarus divergens]
MAWTPILLMLLSYCTGSLSQPVLTQPPPSLFLLEQQPDSPVALSSGFNVGSYQTYWIQQQPGRPPRDLLYYSSDSDKRPGSGVPGWFSGCKYASANAGLLRISGLQAEAEVDSHWATASQRRRKWV